MKLQTSHDLLISQWKAAPKFCKLVNEYIEIFQGVADNLLATDRPDVSPGDDDFDDATAVMEKMLHVDTAEGVWLDYIALRLGLYRPMVVNNNDQDVFGYRNANNALPFDTAPFAGALRNIVRIPLSDIEFRRMVKARGIAVTSRGDIQSFERAVHFIDPSAIVEDGRSMVITIKTDNQTAIERADDHQCIPRVAGVRINYETSPGFGLDKAGGTFDKTRFKDNE